MKHVSNQGRRGNDTQLECTNCRRMLPHEAFTKNAGTKCGRNSWCRSCDNTRKRDTRLLHVERERKRTRKWYEQNRDRQLIKEKEYLARLRSEVLAAYGGKCECCGEATIEFLCIDHVNGDGKQDRKRGRVGRAMYLHLIREGFPKDRYRLLCHNCNMTRGLYGYCPHEKGTK